MKSQRLGGIEEGREAKRGTVDRVETELQQEPKPIQEEMRAGGIGSERGERPTDQDEDATCPQACPEPS